jgi:hypothetical protein
MIVLLVVQAREFCDRSFGNFLRVGDCCAPNRVMAQLRHVIC